MSDLESMRTADATWLGFIEHLRTHESMDAPILTTIKKDGGNLTGESARLIAVHYQVARNFPSTVEDRYLQIAAEVNKAAAEWPETSDERIDACLDLVNTIHTRLGTRNRTVSAVTKFLWFVRPRHWLPFDRHAANGLVGVAPAVEERMRRYFQQLERGGFPVTADRMTTILQSADLTGLSGERLVDKALMIRGLRKKPAPLLGAIVENNFIYLSALPQEQRAKIMDVADDLARQFPDGGVPREARISRRKKR